MKAYKNYEQNNNFRYFNENIYLFNLLINILKIFVIIFQKKSHIL